MKIVQIRINFLKDFENMSRIIQSCLKAFQSAKVYLLKYVLLENQLDKS